MLDITQIYSKPQLLEAARADALAVFRIGERIRLEPSRLPTHIVACTHAALASGRGILDQLRPSQNRAGSKVKCNTF